MQPYTGFASVYDLFMDDIPYDAWADYIQKLLKKFNIESGLVLELGCGTGSVTRRLACKGFDMIGIDNSEEMLQIAREKGDEWSDSILYLIQDMREFELFGTVAAVICLCDTMNYLTNEEDLLKVFRLVNNYLDPGGIFIFDMDTPYAYQEVLADNTVAENREEGSFIWENAFYEDEMVNEVTLTVFLPDSEDNNSESDRNKPVLFRKYEETHTRKAYPVDTIKRMIEEAGMEWIAAYDDLTERKPGKDSERIYIIAREKRQQNKLYTEHSLTNN